MSSQSYYKETSDNVLWRDAKTSVQIWPSILAAKPVSGMELDHHVTGSHYLCIGKWEFYKVSEVSVQRVGIGPLVWTLVSFYHRSTGLIKPLLPFSARHTDLSSTYHPLKDFHYQIAEILWKYRKVPVSVGAELRRPIFHNVWQSENLNNLQGATGTFHTGGPLALWQ